MAYSDKVLDHYENPRNVGSFDKNDQNVGTGMVGAPACGDVMKLQIMVDESGIIRDAKFKTYGCGSAIASSSLVTEWVREQVRAAGGAEPAELYQKLVDAVEPALLDEVLRQLEGNRLAAARWLGLARATVRKMIRKYHPAADEPEADEA